MRRGQLLRAVLLGLVTAAIGCGFVLTGPGAALEQQVGLRWLFQLRGPLAAPADVVLVDMARQHAAGFSASGKLRDWSRVRHADLVDKLVARGASVIVFDIMFEAPRADDAAFAAAIARAGRVVLFQDAGHERQSAWSVDTLSNPVESLQQAAAGLAPFPLPEPKSGRVDHFWAFFDRVNNAPTLPVVALQLHALHQTDYPAFKALLESSGLEHELPEQLTDAVALRRLMDRLRSEFSRAPALAGQFLRILAQQPDLSAEARQTLAALVQVYRGTSHPLFNYYGPPGTLRRTPYTAFWDPERAGSLPDLTGKVVFVGSLDPDLRDDFYTVFTDDDGLKLNGVEIAATAFANLAQNQTLRCPPAAVEIGLLLVFGLLLGLSAYLLSGVAALAAVVLTGAAYGWSAQFLFASGHWWLPLFTPLVLQTLFALLAGLSWRYKWLDKVFANFSRVLVAHVPQPVVERAFTSGEPILPEVVYGTCLVSDVADYTPLSERLEKIDQQLLARLSNEYFTALIERVNDYRGLKLNTVGDGMTCVWPAARPDRAIRLNACLAGLDILRAALQFNRRYPDYVFKTRIGLNAGWVAMGDLGGAGQFNYGVTGNTVNTASRIEGLNKYLCTHLLAAESVVGDLDELLLRRVGRFQLKGKGEVMTIYQILNQQAAASAEEHLLCERFAAALEAYEDCHWAEAARRFAALADCYPADGPTRFYLERCRRYGGAPPPDADPVIHLDQK